MSKHLIHPAGKSPPGRHPSPVPGAKRATRRPAAQPAPPTPTAPAPADDDSEPPHGLFGATELAINDTETETERLADSEETLPELEREIGIADWIDPQTGEPAEGQSPPHLENE